MTIDGFEMHGVEDYWLATGGVLVLQRRRGAQEILDFRHSWDFAQVESEANGE